MVLDEISKESKSSCEEMQMRLSSVIENFESVIKLLSTKNVDYGLGFKKYVLANTRYPTTQNTSLLGFYYEFMSLS